MKQLTEREKSYLLVLLINEKDRIQNEIEEAKRLLPQSDYIKVLTNDLKRIESLYTKI